MIRTDQGIHSFLLPTDLLSSFPDSDSGHVHLVCDDISSLNASTEVWIGVAAMVGVAEGQSSPATTLTCTAAPLVQVCLIRARRRNLACARLRILTLSLKVLIARRLSSNGFPLALSLDLSVVGQERIRTQICEQYNYNTTAFHRYTAVSVLKTNGK